MRMLCIKVDILCIYYQTIVCKVLVLRAVVVQGRFIVVVEVSSAILGPACWFYSSLFLVLSEPRPHLPPCYCVGGGGRSSSCQPQLS